MKTPLILVQARIGSTRLYGKVLKPILDRPMLFYTLERLKMLQTPAKIVLATSDLERDHPLELLAHENKISCFRGSEEDVLHRFYQAALNFNAQVLVRVTGDCPLVEPSLLDKMLTTYLDSQNKVDYLSNVHPRSFPKGLDLEIFSFKALEYAHHHTQSPYDREHVTPFFYNHPHLFSLSNYEHSENLSHLNLSVDTPADFKFVASIFKRFYSKKKGFEIKDIKDELLNPATRTNL